MPPHKQPNVFRFNELLTKTSVIYTQTCQPFIDCHVDSTERSKSARYFDVFVIENSNKIHVDNIKAEKLSGKTVTRQVKSNIAGTVFYKCHH